MPSIEHHIETAATTPALRAALTTAEGLRGWWSVDCDVSEDGPGGEHHLRFAKDDRTVDMHFRVDIDEPDRVRWTCIANGNPVWVGTTLEWRLDGGTVHFVHDGFAEDRSPPFQMTRDGWKHFCASLRAYVETGSGEPW